jgi:hypothetical protein
MIMSTKNHQTFDWATASYLGCDDSSTTGRQEIWTELDGIHSSEPNRGIAPYLLTHTSSEKSEQVTPRLTQSPTELFWERVPETAVVVNQPGDEILWPMLQADSFQEQEKVWLEHQATKKQDTELQNTDEKMAATHSEAYSEAPRPVMTGRPTQRKRGRPRKYFPQSEVQSGNTSRADFSSERQFHLEKIRIAAAKCRERSKGHVVELVARASDLSSKNKTLKAEETALREQILNIKNEVLRHAGCGSWAIDGYVSQCAGDILGVKAPSAQTPTIRRDSAQLQLVDDSTKNPENFVREIISESPIGQGSIDLSTESDELDSLRVFNIYGDMERQQNWEVQPLC